MDLQETLPEPTPSLGRDNVREPAADQLIAEAQLGSAAALDRLIEMLSAHLVAELGGRRVRGLSPSRSGSDLIQETVVRAREKFAQFKKHTFTEFKQWARGILHLRRRHWMRNHRDRTNQKKMERIWLAVTRRRNLLDRARGGDGARVLERKEEAAKATAAFERLQPHQQYIVTLRVIEGLSFRQIAVIVKSSEGAVSRAHRRAIKRLGMYFNAHEKN